MIKGWQLLPILLAATACAADEEAPPSAGPGATVAADERPAVVFMGTSLTAGLGLDPSEAYPAYIQRRIDNEELPFSVVNAGVSGETSAGARQRIDWLLRRPVEVLVIETGANDGLRGLDPEAMRKNLDEILERAARKDPPPALIVVGMEAPPNLGERYTGAFRSVFRETAEKHGAAFVPFLLEGVAGVPSLNQGDGIHPTSEGQRRMANNVWRVLEPILRERAASVAAGR
jgi:acyl-CoA thioesterase-1